MILRVRVIIPPMRKGRLFTPGPTPLIPGAQLAMARSLLHHRTPEFKSLLLETKANLQRIFKTHHEVLILSSSGTGAMEAAVASLHSPGDKVIPVVAGKFGERWAELARAYELKSFPLCKEYGEAASASEVVSALRAEADARSILLQACETSTATAHDLKAIAQAVRAEFPDVLIVVDAISALGSQPLETDNWDLDVVICGSQKAFGIPPGLSALSLSPRAVRALEANDGRHRYYFDLCRELESQSTGSTAFTPAIALIVALHEASSLMLKEGLDSIVKGAELMARSTRAGLAALGFGLLSKSPANAVTAAFPPTGFGADDLRKQLDREFGIKVAGGQGSLKGKIIRIGHLGYLDFLDVVTVLAAVEICLSSHAAPVEIGKGVTAAMELWRSSTRG